MDQANAQTDSHSTALPGFEMALRAAVRGDVSFDPVIRGILAYRMIIWRIRIRFA